jgi:hypothetical protein
MVKEKTIVVKADGYEAWIRSIKERIQRAHVKASMLVNFEQTLLYWDIGHDTLEKQDKEGWGTKVVERISADLKAEIDNVLGEITAKLGGAI